MPISPEISARLQVIQKRGVQAQAALKKLHDMNQADLWKTDLNSLVELSGDDFLRTAARIGHLRMHPSAFDKEKPKEMLISIATRAVLVEQINVASEAGIYGENGDVILEKAVTIFEDSLGREKQPKLAQQVEPAENEATAPSISADGSLPDGEPAESERTSLPDELLSMLNENERAFVKTIARLTGEDQPTGDDHQGAFIASLADALAIARPDISKLKTAVNAKWGNKGMIDSFEVPRKPGQIGRLPQKYIVRVAQLDASDNTQAPPAEEVGVRTTSQEPASETAPADAFEDLPADRFNRVDNNSLYKLRNATVEGGMLSNEEFAKTLFPTPIRDRVMTLEEAVKELPEQVSMINYQLNQADSLIRVVGVSNEDRTEVIGYHLERQEATVAELTHETIISGESGVVLPDGQEGEGLGVPSLDAARDLLAQLHAMQGDGDESDAATNVPLQPQAIPTDLGEKSPAS